MNIHIYDKCNLTKNCNEKTVLKWRQNSNTFNEEPQKFKSIYCTFQDFCQAN